ncbi:hypothetical protein F6Y05_35525 [Bacillus megaterium]|nr:hypothetical protein [Priestia megaterium]
MKENSRKLESRQNWSTSKLKLNKNKPLFFKNIKEMLIMRLDLNFEVEKQLLKEKGEELEIFISERVQFVESIEDILNKTKWLLETVLIDAGNEVSSYVLSEEEASLAESDPKSLITNWRQERAVVEDNLGKFKRNLEKTYHQLV